MQTDHIWKGAKDGLLIDNGGMDTPQAVFFVGSASRLCGDEDAFLGMGLALNSCLEYVTALDNTWRCCRHEARMWGGERERCKSSRWIVHVLCSSFSSPNLRQILGSLFCYC
jgi:hypothetical protein